MYLLFYWMSQHSKKSIQAQIKQFELALSTAYCNDDRKELEWNNLIFDIIDALVMVALIMLPWDIFSIISVAIINILCVKFEM